MVDRTAKSLSNYHKNQYQLLTTTKASHPVFLVGVQNDQKHTATFLSPS